MIVVQIEKNNQILLKLPLSYILDELAVIGDKKELAIPYPYWIFVGEVKGPQNFKAVLSEKVEKKESNTPL